MKTSVFVLVTYHGHWYAHQHLFFRVTSTKPLKYINISISIDLFYRNKSSINVYAGLQNYVIYCENP